MKAGDKLYCIKDMFGQDLGGPYYINRAKEYYFVKLFIGFNNDIYISTENENMHRYSLNFNKMNYVYDFFYTEKEIRKLKLEKLKTI